MGGGRLELSHPLARRAVFTLPSGTAIATDDVRGIVQRMASAAGEDPREFGAKSLRAGGATDLSAAAGWSIERATAAIKARGRWWSDVYKLYRRALLGEQLDASRAVGDAEGADMEAVCAGWCQPR